MDKDNYYKRVFIHLFSGFAVKSPSVRSERWKNMD